MDDPGEIGEWWLPSTPDAKAPGWLRQTQEHRTSLLLAGSLSDPFTTTGTYRRIHGRIGNQAVTCEDCFRSRTGGNLLGGLNAEVVEVNQAYRGVWFDDGEEPGGTGLAADLPLLRDWVAPHSLTVDWTAGDGSSSDAVILRAERLEPIVLRCSLGDLRLIQTLQTSGDGVSSRTIEQSLIAQIDVEEVIPAATFLDEIAVLADAVSLASERYVATRSVQLLHPDVVHREGSPVRRPIEMLAQWTPGSDLPLKRERVLAEYQAIGVPGLQRLLHAVSAIRIPVRRAVVTRHQEGAFNSDRLINVCAALEALDRLAAPERRSFTQRIRQCVDLAGPPATELLGNRDRWIGWLRRRRDHVAHHLLPTDNRDGLEDLALAESAYLVFVLCVFRLADLPDEVFVRIGEGPWLQWLRNLLAEVHP